MNENIKKLGVDLSELDFQIIWPVLKTKLSSLVNKDENVILELNSESKLFRIEEIESGELNVKK